MGIIYKIFTVTVFCFCNSVLAANNCHTIFKVEKGRASSANSQITTPTYSENYHKAFSAISNAPESLKLKILENNMQTFRKTNQRTAMEALAILQVLGVPRSELQNIARQAFKRSIDRAPTRNQTFMLSSSNKIFELSGPTVDVNIKTSFFEKWGLNEYKQMIDRVYNELLPREYKERGFYEAGLGFNFSTSGLFHQLRVLHALGLHEESLWILKVFLIYKSEVDFRKAALLLGRDDLLFKGGLLTLANYYVDPRHPLRGNNLWDAIEMLKMVQSPSLREEVKELFIDLSNDLLSKSFQKRLRGMYENTAEGQEAYQAEYSSVLYYIMRGLKASGKILYYTAEDSIKVDITSVSTDKKLQVAIRRVLKYAEQNELLGGGTEKILALLQVTNDKQELNKRVKQLEAKQPIENYSAVALYYAALGNVEKATQYFIYSLNKQKGDDSLIKYDYQDILVVANRSGALEKLLDHWSGVFSEKRMEYVKSVFIDWKKDNKETYTVRHATSEYLANSFGVFVDYHGHNSSEILLKAAQASESRGESQTAAVQYTDAAYARYLEEHGQQAAE